MVDVVLYIRRPEDIVESLAESGILCAFAGLGTRVDAVFCELHHPRMRVVGECLTELPNEHTNIPKSHLGIVVRREGRAEQVGRVGVERYTPLTTAGSVCKASDDGLTGQHAVFGVIIRLAAEELVQGREDFGGGLLCHDPVIGVVVVGGDLVQPVVLVARRTLATADIEPVVAADFVVDDLTILSAAAFDG